MINNNIIIDDKISLLESLAIMDKLNRKLLIICNGNKFLGVVSIGDIQRALLDKQDLSLPVKNFGRSSITFATVDDDLSKVKELMRKNRIEAMPIIDKNSHLIDVIEWDQLFDVKPKTVDKLIDLPVVIMAGGKGTRLLPLTNVIPKPLIPISDKTIIEEIMCKFKSVGCHEFYISVNYMMKEIENYFKGSDWDIHFIREEKPLGTGGALFYLNEHIKDTFFVINCDTLVDVNLNDLLAYHQDNNNLITVVSAVKTIHIPYGTLETGSNGIIKEIKEKPDYIYQVNSGFYVLDPFVLNYVVESQFLNITDLIDRIIKDGKNVGAFPVSEKSWVDMGNWEEYLKLVNIYMNTKS